jgi:hypothetical protein
MHEIFEFIDGLVLPKQRRGRPKRDNGIVPPKQRRGRPKTDNIQCIEQLTKFAKEGLRSRQCRTRYHAAVVLSRFLPGGSTDTTVKRLYPKLKDAGVD